MNRINKEYKSIDERINILKHSYFDIINANKKLFVDMSDTWKNGKSKYQKMDKTIKKEGSCFSGSSFFNFFN